MPLAHGGGSSYYGLESSPSLLLHLSIIVALLILQPMLLLHCQYLVFGSYSLQIPPRGEIPCLECRIWCDTLLCRVSYPFTACRRGWLALPSFSPFLASLLLGVVLASSAFLGGHFRILLPIPCCANLQLDYCSFWRLIIVHPLQYIAVIDSYCNGYHGRSTAHYYWPRGPHPALSPSYHQISQRRSCHDELWATVAILEAAPSQHSASRLNLS